jgi:molecular chaperone DnaK (HSP70)
LRNAERYFDGPIPKAVITVPAYFNDARREATKTQASRAGSSSPGQRADAASLAYGLDKKKNGIGGHDLGGTPSTFRFSSSRRYFQSSRPTATRIWAATTLTACSSTSRR